jgi:uncharacterized protein YbjQ (UPF0145 family)
MTTTTPTDLTSQEAAERAVNQLLSLVVGQVHARLTDELKDKPVERVAKCVDLVMEDYKDAMASGNSQSIRQLQRKADSLGSLAILATLVAEIEW